MNIQKVLQIQVSIKGRPLDTFRFEEGEISIGREPSSSIFLDNPGVSRQHARIEFAESGLEVIDTDSGNGTFLNEKQIERSPLQDGDVIRIGKFTLGVEITEQRQREDSDSPDSMGDEAEHTVFLQAGEQARILSESKQAEQGLQPGTQPTAHSSRSSRSGSNQVPFASAVKIFLAGTIFGIVCTWLFMS